MYIYIYISEFLIVMIIVDPLTYAFKLTTHVHFNLINVRILNKYIESKLRPAVEVG